MAFSPKFAPPEQICLRHDTKPLIRPSGTFSHEGRRGAGGWDRSIGKHQTFLLPLWEKVARSDG
ncbi:hypothetical protein ASE94_07185 [Devosia sp. Leaf64]|nr:hypothetical protein ASE94_07185 [Devosia sp. Leaf64]